MSELKGPELKGGKVNRIGGIFFENLIIGAIAVVFGYFIDTFVFELLSKVDMPDSVALPIGYGIPALFSGFVTCLYFKKTGRKWWYGIFGPLLVYLIIIVIALIYLKYFWGGPDIW